MRSVALFAVFFGLSVSTFLNAEEGKVITPPKPLTEDTKTEVVATTEVKAVAATSFLISNVAELPVMAKRMKAHGYEPGFGHSAAPALLVNCLSGVDAEKKVDYLNEVILNLGRDVGNSATFRRDLVEAERRLNNGEIRRSGQAARFAAVLACKIGNRTLDTLLSDFDNAVTELNKVMGKELVPVFYSLQTVVNLMN